MTYDEIAAGLKAAKRSAVDNGCGDEPAGYPELDADAATVADACWHKGMDDLEIAFLNWAHDHLAADQDRAERLEFACNTLRLDLGIDPTISNLDTPRIVAAFQDALRARSYGYGAPPTVHPR